MALWLSVADKNSKEEPGDVRVDDRHPLPERKALHRTHRVRAQSLEGAEGCRVRGQPPTVFRYDFARDRVESSRTDVVSQRPPGAGRLTRSRRCQGLHRREPLKPLFVLGLDPVHLGLLQHDLRDQNLIRIAGSSPREVASVSVIPAEEAIAKTPSRWGRREPGCFPTTNLGGLHQA